MNTAQSTTASETVQEHERKLKQLRRLARKVLQLRVAEREAADQITDYKPEIVALMHELGLSIVEAAPGQSLQLVEPVTRKHNEEAIEAYIRRYRPDLHDRLFPPVRKLDTGKLRDAIDAGEVPRTIEKHITDVAGTPQLRRVVR